MIWLALWLYVTGLIATYFWVDTIIVDWKPIDYFKILFFPIWLPILFVQAWYNTLKVHFFLRGH